MRGRADRDTSGHCSVHVHESGPADHLGILPVMKTVAVIGASTDRRKFGNKAVRAFASAGYTVIPITPHHDTVEGLRAYPSVVDVPGPIDMATIYVPPDVGEQLLDDIARKAIPEVWLNPGAESAALRERARALGLAPIEACSIVAVGLSPSRF